ncbi:MAG: precorrin-2 C(20)-methyltransferase [SAR324 cluster bacterium]|uniref:Precorrin-2 C(20)-methyltransferase n=1 Tax=SAR324 cluster bacterium TaxID=2024889 RepID=A0A2A4SUN2_9DELT|nr:MAG: precorrin-2 C(20)-methyltransferase [SAR324 cluster bacterium]
MKKLYGIGIGPGDPDLITVKAVKLIQGASKVFVPKSKTESLAGSIAGEYLEGKEVIELQFPMGKDNRERYIKAAATINDALEDGEYTVFLTLGDPLVYSTFMYLMIEAKKLGITVATVPGITSYNAAASLLVQPITTRDQSFYLADGQVDEQILERVDSVCVLKTTKNKEETLDKLERHGFSYTYVKRCTREGELILTDREAILQDRDYMSLILAKKG